MYERDLAAAQSIALSFLIQNDDDSGSADWRKGGQSHVDIGQGISKR